MAPKKGPKKRSEEPAGLTEETTGQEEAVAEQPASGTSRRDVAYEASQGLDAATEGDGDDQPEGLVDRAMDAAQKDQLPDNKWSRGLKAFEKECERLGQKGPVVNGVKTIFALMAYYAHLADLIPGNYEKRLDEDPKLKSEQFSKEDLERILAAEKPAQWPSVSNPEALKKQGAGRASTIHAVSTLWGISGIEDPDTLSAKLKHAGKKIGDNVVPYYRTAGYFELTSKGMPFGTVLIFDPDIETAERVVAYATGNGTECRFFNANSGEVETVSLSEEGKPSQDSPIYGLNLLSAFVPKFNSDPEWFKQNTDQLDKRVNDTPAGSTLEAAKLGKDVESNLANYHEVAMRDSNLDSAESVRRGVDYETGRFTKTAVEILERFKSANVSGEVLSALRELAETLIKTSTIALEIHKNYYEKIKKETTAAMTGASGALKAEAETKAAAKLKPFEDSQRNAREALALAKSLKAFYENRS